MSESNPRSPRRVIDGEMSDGARRAMVATAARTSRAAPSRFGPEAAAASPASRSSGAVTRSTSLRTSVRFTLRVAVRGSGTSMSSVTAGRSAFGSSTSALSRAALAFA